MSQYILISRIKVQNANAVAGFTWGFPAITHFLGYTHNLARKLPSSNDFNDIYLSGCAVVAHEHHVHTYGKYDAEFIQSRNPPYLTSHDKKMPPPIVEEGKMNMTVSLLIGCSGNIGNREDSFVSWLEKACLTQRLAGGTIINDQIEIRIFSSDVSNLRLIKRKLLPGFFLMDRSHYLQEHYKSMCKKSICEENPELLDAWMDFSALKKKARPKSDLIGKHLVQQSKEEAENHQAVDLKDLWLEHLKKPYPGDSIPNTLIQYFSSLELSESNKKLLEQWHNYIKPDEDVDADWEYIPKPQPGYLVPIMTGYKAISPLYPPNGVKNTRDSETPVSFVEATHTVGEWLSVHRIRSMEELNNCLWYYQYEENWYLCRQLLESSSEPESKQSSSDETSEDDWY
jgi:CRISPR-associated protein Csy2